MNIYPTPEERKAMILAQMHELRDKLRKAEANQAESRKKTRPKK